MAVRTPAASNVAANNVPQPAATPRLSQIDHVLMVSVHPPGAPGSAGAIDHAFPLSDHQPLNRPSVDQTVRDTKCWSRSSCRRDTI